MAYKIFLLFFCVFVYLSALQQELKTGILFRLLPVIWLLTEVFAGSFAQLRLQYGFILS